MERFRQQIDRQGRPDDIVLVSGLIPGQLRADFAWSKAFTCRELPSLPNTLPSPPSLLSTRPFPATMMEVEEAVQYHDADMVPEDVAIDYADEIMQDDHAFAIPEVDMEHDASNDEEIEYDMEDLSAPSETVPSESTLPPSGLVETISTSALHHPQTPSPLGKAAPETAFLDAPHDVVTETSAPAPPETSYQPATEVEPAPVPLPHASDALVSAEAPSLATHSSLNPTPEQPSPPAVHTHSASPVAEPDDGPAHREDDEAEGGPSQASQPKQDQGEPVNHSQEASEPAAVETAVEHSNTAAATISAPNDAQEEYNEEVNSEVYPSSVLISNPHTSSLPSFYLFVAPDSANGDELVYLADEAHLFFEPISSVFEALRAHEDHLGVPGNVELSLYSEGLDLNVSEVCPTLRLSRSSRSISD